MDEKEMLAKWRASLPSHQYHEPSLECTKGRIKNREMIENEYLTNAVSRIIDRYSCSEISAILGYPETTIKALIRRIRSVDKNQAAA